MVLLQEDLSDLNEETNPAFLLAVVGPSVSFLSPVDLPALYSLLA